MPKRIPLRGPRLRRAVAGRNVNVRNLNCRQSLSRNCCRRHHRPEPLSISSNNCAISTLHSLTNSSSSSDFLSQRLAAQLPRFSLVLPKLTDQISAGGKGVPLINVLGGVVLALAAMDGLLLGLKYFTLNKIAISWLNSSSSLIYFSEAVLFYVGAAFIARGTYSYTQMVEVLSLIVFTISPSPQLIGFSSCIPFSILSSYCQVPSSTHRYLCSSDSRLSSSVQLSTNTHHRRSPPTTLRTYFWVYYHRAEQIGIY